MRQTGWPLPLFSAIKLFFCSSAKQHWTLMVEILLASHWALLLCSIWSQACTILCWIFFSEESSIKWALIIHDARFRFVPHCSETEISPLCYFAAFFFFFKSEVQFNNFFTGNDILLIIYYTTKVSSEGWFIPKLCTIPLPIISLRTFYKSLFILEMTCYQKPDKV